MYNKNVRYKSDYYLIENNVVSIILGVKCENSIILASDSQGNFLEEERKSLKEKKIFKDHMDKTVFIYAGAEEPYFNKLIFEETLKPYKSSLDFARLCEKAIIDVGDRYPQKKNDKGELPFKLLIGLANKEKSEFELYLAKPDGVVAPTKSMIAIGRRNDWAETIYGEILSYESDFTNEDIILDIMLFTIKKIKDYDLYCGGTTQYYILDKDCNNIDSIRITDEKRVKKFEEERFKEINNKFKETWWGKLGEEQDEEKG